MLGIYLKLCNRLKINLYFITLKLMLTNYFVHYSTYLHSMYDYFQNTTDIQIHQSEIIKLVLKIVL